MTALEKARKILKLTFYEDSISRTVDSAITGIVPFIKATAEQHRAIAKEIQSTFAEHQSVMLEIVASAYVSTYSDKELDGLIEFYGSEVGKAIVSKDGLLEERNSKNIAEYQNAILIPELMSRIDKLQKGYEEDSNDEGSEEK